MRALAAMAMVALSMGGSAGRGRARTAGDTAHRARNAYRAAHPHRHRCGLQADGDGLARQDSAVVGIASGRQGKPGLLRTLRVPIGDGDGGKVYAVALSPMANGWLPAAGTHTTPWIRPWASISSRRARGASLPG